MKRQLYIICLIILNTILTHSARHDIRFSHVGMEQGLSHSTVNGIAQDGVGYIWIATPDGLNRYDGHNFNILIPDTTDHNIRAVATDPSGNVWAITAHHLLRYNQGLHTFTHSSIGDNTTLSTLLPINNETIAIGTDKGLFYFNARSQEFSPESNTTAYTITALTEFEGNLIAGTSSGTVISCNQGKTVKICEPLGAGINVLLPDNGKLLIGTEGKGLFIYNPTDKKTTPLPVNIPSKYIRSLIPDSQRRLWVGTFTGLFVLDPEYSNVVFHEDATAIDGGLSHSSVRRMFADNQGGIWLGTYYGGLNYYNPQHTQFTTLRKHDDSPFSISGNIVGPLAEAANGDIWIGTNNGGVNIYSPSSGVFKKLSSKNGLGSDDVKAIYIDDTNKKAYIGTHTGGITEINLNNQTATRHQDVAENVYAILSAKENGYLWLATLDGLKYYNPATNASYDVPAKNLPSQTTGLMRDSKNRIWVSGEGGLSVYAEDNDKLTLLPDIPAMTVHVNDTYQSRTSGIFWISTHQGLYGYDEKTGIINHYDSQDGLPGDIVYAAIEDPNSNIWVSTNRGLAYLNPDSGKIMTYSNRYGLKNTQFSERSVLFASNGRLYFGGINGLTYFNPTILERNPIQASPIIEGVRIPINSTSSNGEESNAEVTMHGDEGITIDSKQKSFTIEFTVCDFISEGQNKFRYMLDGLDNQWITLPSGVRSVSYSNLPAGNYLFRLQVANNDGIWSKDEATLKIKILPPWYRTWWAITIFSVLILGTTALAVTSIMKRKIRDKQQKAQQEVTEMKVRFFVNLSHELRTPLTLILLPINDLIASNPDPVTLQKLHLVRNNALRIQHIVNQLLDYRRAELGMFKLKVTEININSLLNDLLAPYRSLAKKKKINLKFDSTIDAEKTVVDTNYIELIVNNLVTNAFKYTPEGGNITVSLSNKDGKLILTVTDNGCGIPSDKLDKIFTRFYQLNDSVGGYGIGLSLVKRLAELHHGKVSVESTVGTGSTFTVTLPIDKNSYSQEEIVPSIEYSPKEVTENNDVSLLVNIDDDTMEIPQASDDDKRKTILLVDDNAEILKYLSAALSTDFKILTAIDGSKAIEILSNEPIDLIISDVMMPDVDGVQLCRAVKRNLRTSHIPLILLSAKADIADRLEAFKVGADDYIAKPFNIDELQAKVKNQIRTRESIIRYYSQENSTIDMSQVAQNPLDEEFLKKAIKILNEHLDDSQFTTDEFAKHMCMSRSNLHLKMKALTGEATNDFIRRTRLRKAAELLKTRRYTVAEVSAMVGYNTPSYFATSFKNFFGYSPSSLLNQ